MNVSVEADIGSSRGDRLRKGDMDRLWHELQVDHLGEQVLSPRIVQSHVAVFTASDEQIARQRVSDRADRQIELSEGVEGVAHAGLFDVEHAHRTSLETTRKDGQRGVSCHTERLVDWTRKFNDLIEGLKVPKTNRSIDTDGNDVLLC